MKKIGSSVVSTGIAGLDDVLRGGLPPGALYLLDGSPGVGKTTLALQFLMRGRDLGEKGLYVTLSETADEVWGIARSHGWTLEGIALYELSAVEGRLQREATQTMFHPAELELEETTRPILEEVERIKPERVVIDSLSEIRLLARDPLRYRREVLALKQFFLGRGCTVLLLDDKTTGKDDHLLASIAHGVISLEKDVPLYGAARRRLIVEKLRGVGFAEGFHDFNLLKGGISVYPRLVATEHKSTFEPGQISSAIPELDSLLSGGVDRGTTVLIQGPAGAGKSSLALRYCWAAAERGEHCAVFNFDERHETVAARSKALGMPLGRHLESGTIRMRQIDPAEVSPGEFAHHIKDLVEREQVRVVMIDSLNGYFYAMPERTSLMLHLHELFGYLGQQGVTSLVTLALQGIIGSNASSFDVSYLADTILLLRFFEAQGEIRRALSVVKRRAGVHEQTIREMTFGAKGISVGKALAEFEGVLTGVPRYRGQK